MTSLSFERDMRPVWDEDKAHIAGSVPGGAIALDFADGEELSGDWFLAVDTDDMQTLGFGFLDVTWGGDAEITLVVDEAHHGKGVGTFIMDNLEKEASKRGINYVYNTVLDTHPERDDVHDWLLVRGYKGNESDASLRKHVGVKTEQQLGPVPTPPAQAPEGAVGRGQEESGDYVDAEAHRF